MRRRPFKPGQNARERPGVIGQRVRNHGQAITRETRGVTIRIQRHRGDLRRNARQHMIQQRAPAQKLERLIPAPHAPRKPARQHKPQRFSRHHWLPLPRCSSANAWHFLLQRNEDQHRK